MINVLRDNLMGVRKDWNNIGPPIPGWFRRKLKRIDSSLVLQFLPPADSRFPDEGVDQKVFPQGMWVVARQLRRTGLLVKKWVCWISEPYERGVQATYEKLRLIKRSRALWRENRLDVLETALDRTIKRLHAEGYAERRAELSSEIMGMCRDMSITKRKLGVPQFLMRDKSSQR